MSSTIADQALRKLLGRGERAQRSALSRAVTLPFTHASFAAYFELPTHAAKEEVHAALREARRAGAISIEWDPRAGEEGQVERLVLKDVQRLADHLQIPSHASTMSRARAALEPWTTDARVAQILEQWAGLRLVRGRSPMEVDDLVGALRVVDVCRSRQGEDLAVRTLSAALFKDSKRLEALEPWLDLLTAPRLQDPRRSAEEVFAGLGLVKYPPAVYVAGNARILLSDGKWLSVPIPFVALAPRAIAGLELAEEIHTLLTVENLTTFHELASGRAGMLTSHLVMFTAGMPAPSFLQFYARALRCLGSRALYHWGDIDPGGFRVAACLARVAHSCGQSLKLWRMKTTELPDALAYRTLPRSETSEIQRICQIHQWLPEAQALERCALGFEQEALTPELPSPCG
jgi:hypothetical protein